MHFRDPEAYQNFLSHLAWMEKPSRLMSTRPNRFLQDCVLYIYTCFAVLLFLFHFISFFFLWRSVLSCAYVKSDLLQYVADKHWLNLGRTGGLFVYHRCCLDLYCILLLIYRCVKICIASHIFVHLSHRAAHHFLH